MSLEKYSFERIIENLHDGLYFVDRDRVITYWNKAAEKLSGYTANEVVGKSCSDNILTHVDSEGNSLCTGMCPLAATIADGKYHEAEIYMHHKDGHRIPVSVRVSSLTDIDGNIIGGIELFTDISNQAVNELRIKELEKLALVENKTLNAYAISSKDFYFSCSSACGMFRSAIFRIFRRQSRFPHESGSVQNHRISPYTSKRLGYPFQIGHLGGIGVKP